MAFTDYGAAYDSMAAAIARAERLHPTHQTYHRNGLTSRWFKANKKKMTGKQLFYRALVQPSTGVRRAQMSGAAETEFPVPLDLAYLEMSILFSDLRMFRATVRYNEIENMRTLNSKEAVAQLAIKYVADVHADFGQQLNAAVHQGGTSAMALVSAIYDADGTTFSLAGAHTTAFIKIKQGSIGQFQKGDVLDIYDTDGTTKNAICVVQGVIYGKDGPPASGSRVSSIGPGILVEPCDATGAVYACNWNGGTMSGGGTSYTPAAGDYIARSGEFTSVAASYKNFHGLPDWFDTTVDVYRDSDGTVIDREDPSYQWMNPEVIVAGTAGSETELDIDTHFREMEEVLPYRINTGRQQRKSDPEKDITLTTVLLGITDAALEADIVTEARSTQRITHTTAMNLDRAKREEWFGHVGFEGFVYHSPNLPPIVLQTDTLARPHFIDFIDPNSFTYYTFGNSDPGHVTWTEEGGDKWQRLEGDTLRTPTFYKQSGAWTACTLQCDQPAVNVEIQYVKSSNE